MLPEIPVQSSQVHYKTMSLLKRGILQPPTFAPPLARGFAATCTHKSCPSAASKPGVGMKWGNDSVDFGLPKGMAKIQPKGPAKRKVLKGTETYRCAQMRCSLAGRGQRQETSPSYSHQPAAEHAALPRQITLHHCQIKKLKKKKIKRGY